MIRAGIVFWGMLYCAFYRDAAAQFLNTLGENPDIREYVESSEYNWNRPIIYIFYNSQIGCEICPQAIEEIYQIYQQNYADTCSLFEIDYSNDFQMKIAYDLSQPLSIVVVLINDGMARGYYKIDNPQDMLLDRFNMRETIINQINNFLDY